MEFLRQATANGHRAAWALKLDVASFFPSIHKETLYEIIARRVRDPELLWLTRVILFHDPTRDYRFKPGPGRVPPPQADRYPVPEEKSLFGKDNARGLPIGNLTSQFWVNVYLDELDQFVKRQLHCRHYVRYVDDLVLLALHPDTLRRWREEIAGCAARRLKLRLREPDAEPQPAGRGIDFVGWRTFWNHRRPRGPTLANCAARVKRFEQRELRPLWNGAVRRFDLGSDDRRLRTLQSTLASYSGHLRYGAAWRAWSAIWDAHGWLGALFESDRRQPWRVRARWPERTIGGPRFSVQYRRLIRRGGDRALVFCQVGRCVEFYGPQRQRAARVLRLLRVAIARGGFGFTVGFPLRVQAAYVSRAVRAGYTVVDVREVARRAPRCAERRLVAVWIPKSVSGLGLRVPQLQLDDRRLFLGEPEKLPCRANPPSGSFQADLFSLLHAYLPGGAVGRCLSSTR